MCQFASFVLTKNNVFWSRVSDSHEQIITEHGLRDDATRILIVRVEISPPDEDPRCSDLAQWSFSIDQDQLPEWAIREDVEHRTREALARRAEEDRWWVTEEGASPVVGYAGTATAGYAGTATAEDAGTATAGDAGTATAGDDGTATAGYAGTATAGDDGTATAGVRGTATAGDDAIIQIRWWDCSAERWRLAIGYVGEHGIDPGVPYCVRDGKLVRKDVEP